MLTPRLVPKQEKVWNDLFKNKVEKDDPLWKEYVEKAAAFDTRMVDEWNKIVDVILVYVGIFFLFFGPTIFCLSLDEHRLHCSSPS